MLRTEVPSNPDHPSTINTSVHKLRSLVIDALEKQLYETALYFSNKLVSMAGSSDDYFRLAQTYFLTNQFQRAYHTLERADLIHSSKKCRYLAAECKAKHNEWEESLEILSHADVDVMRQSDEESEPQQQKISLDAAICLLQGRGFEALEDRKRAIYYYKQALKNDVFCFEAFQILIDKHMLTSTEEQELLESLDFGGNDWLKQLYQCRLKKYNSENSPDMDLIEQYNLANDSEIVAARAETYFYHNQFEKAHSLTQKVLSSDPFNHGNILVVHLSSQVELGKKSDLFYIAHKLVSTHPSLAVSWYAVGCYYYLIRKYERARRYFSKSTTCSREFGPGWLGFGHAFAIEGEHDQALAAYRSAHRLLSRSHLPPLCIGIELVRANNLPLARQFITKSKSICPYDPLVFNELGVIDFKDGKYEDAVVNFQKAVGLLTEESAMVTWEPIFFNLGHCYRKQRQYKNAVKYYKKALKLCPHNGSTYTALGFTNHLMGNTEVAIELYHNALAINPDDNFASTMLLKGLQEHAFTGYPTPDLANISIGIDDDELPSINDTGDQDMSLDVPVDMDPDFQ